MNARPDTFARRVFFWAGLYGLLVLAPMYLMEDRLGQMFPPAITHPENFYGFIGVAIAWQLAFLVISRDPVRYRALMLPAIAEKLLGSGPAFVLYALGRLPGALLGAAAVDMLLAALFFVAWRRTRQDG